MLTAIFLSLAVKLRCAIEKILLMTISAIFAVALFASILGPGTFFSAKVAIMCGWFSAAAACGFWTFHSGRHATGGT